MLSTIVVWIIHTLRDSFQQLEVYRSQITILWAEISNVLKWNKFIHLMSGTWTTFIYNIPCITFCICFTFHFKILLWNAFYNLSNVIIFKPNGNFKTMTKTLKNKMFALILWNSSVDSNGLYHQWSLYFARDNINKLKQF